jgi:lactoylglutathione lyase
MSNNGSLFLGLRTTIYKVSNITEAKEWYSKAFMTQAYFDEPFYVGFNIGGYELGLLPEDEDPGQKVDTVLSYWGVEDIYDVYKHLLELGATEHEKPTNVGGELMVATVKDPWANIIGIIYNPYFKLPE